MACSAPASCGSSLRPASEVRSGSEMPSTLNIEPMPPRPRVGQPLQRAGDIGGDLRRGLGHQRRRAGLDAEPLEEIALRHRAVHARAEIFGGARQRLEIDMGGDVGLAGIFQGIGKAVAGDGLKGVAGIAAQMAVIDDQRRAILVAHAGRDLHDLGIGPPFEHRADRGRAHQRRQQHLEARRRLGGGAEHQLAVVVELDHALVPAGLALHHLVDRQHVEIFIGEDHRRALGHVVDAVVPGDVAHARQRRASAFRAAPD